MNKFIARILVSLACCSLLMALSQCSNEPPKEKTTTKPETSLIFGADLSFVNQILDHGGVYKDNGSAKDPYAIFKDNGTTLVRLRLWHNPTWTKEVYGEAGDQLYNDLKDVERAMTSAKAQGMKVLLDFHYSDTWADPSKQFIPKAWLGIKEIGVLRDSVYNYTLKTLQYLSAKSLMPEYVQIGNETNCGMLFSEAPDGFPACNVCSNQWSNMGKVVNAGIKAVRDASAASPIKTKVLLHVADPKNVEWWFDNIKSQAMVTDFDMIGFSYYPLWHTTVKPPEISDKIAGFKTRYGKGVMILETAYPWAATGSDNYNNQFGSQTPLGSYPFTDQGQFDFLKKLTEEVKDGGGAGVVYWEPAWITSSMKDLWGTGSSWENCTLFNFSGEVNKGMEYMQVKY
jgi:arabinogalactan endo-1,4-beta-galactosidase